MWIIGVVITDDETERQQAWCKVSKIAYFYLALKNKNQQLKLAQVMSNKLTSKNVVRYFAS